MIKVGLIGESEYDRESMKNLLTRLYGEKVHFTHLLKSLPGTYLDTEKALKLLAKELVEKPIDAIIVQRDLDAPESNAVKIAERKAFFNDVSLRSAAPVIRLLHIQMLEALILADLNGFNKRFKATATFTGDPMHQEKPKRWLRDKCKRDAYEAKHSPELFLLLDIEKLKKVRYFKKFINEFEHYLNNKAA